MAYGFSPQGEVGLFNFGSMLTFWTTIGGIGLVAVSALGLLLVFHGLLIREMMVEKKLQSQRLRQLEALVKEEVSRSQYMQSQVQNLDQLRATTDEKLGLIRILIELMQKDEKKDP